MVERGNVIAVFGTGKAVAGDEAFRIAYEVGKELARKDFVVANGGYGGTMLASAKGARQAGGEVIGVTCSAFRRSRANEYITKEITTDSLGQRLETLVQLGAGYVVFSGGTGTLLELAYVWEFKNKGFLPAGKPIIIVGEFWKPLMELIEGNESECAGCVEVAESPRRVVEILGGLTDESIL